MQLRQAFDPFMHRARSPQLRHGESFVARVDDLIDDQLGDQRSYIDPCENGGDLDDDIMPAPCAADSENLVGEVADSGYEEESIKAVVVVFSRRAAGRAARYNNEVASSKDVSDVCLKPSPRR